jgi:hypothetical protein
MKKYIVKRGPWNRIGYRELDSFERRNPEWIAVAKKIFDTWDQAHLHLLETRAKELVDAKRELKAAERRWLSVKAMKKPEAA